MSAEIAINHRFAAVEADLANAKCRISALESARPQAGLLATFGFVADAGKPDAEQAAIAALMAGFDANEYWFGGDNIYTTPVSQAGYSAAFANFGFAFGRARPCLGNHDLDGDPLGSQALAFFGSDQMPARYYTVDYPACDLALFVLNTGLDSSEVVREPDGITIGSAQYWWLVNALKASQRRHKVVMGHHPFVSTSSEADSTFPQLDWRFETLGVNLCLFGHVHGNEHIRQPGLDILNCSAIPPNRDTLYDQLYGSARAAVHIWNDKHGVHDVSDAAATRISVYSDRLWVDVFRAFDGKLIHTFCVR